MVKHTQTIRRQQPTNCSSVFDHFVGLAIKILKTWMPHKQADLGTFKTSMVKFQQLKSSIIGIWQGPEYASPPNIL